MLKNSRLRWLAGGAAMLVCCAAQGQGSLPCDDAVGAPPARATPAPCAQPAPCDSPSPRHVYVCPCPTCKDRGGQPETAPGQPELGPGAYVAPPQTGVQVEGSRQVSFGGLAIRFPEFRLEMPTIELPRRTARTRGAHMELDRAIADFRSLPAQPTPQYAYAAARQEVQSEEPEMGSPETGRPEADSDIDDMRKRCECMAEQLRQKEALLNSKLMELEHQLQRLQSVPSPAPCPVPQPQCPVPQCPVPQPPPTVKPAPSNPAKAVEELPAPHPEVGTGMHLDALPLEYLAPPLPLIGRGSLPATMVAPATYHDSLHSAAAPAAKRPVRLPRR